MGVPLQTGGGKISVSLGSSHSADLTVLADLEEKIATYLNIVY